MLTEFGKRLRDIRLERNLLLKDMADSLRCSVVQLSAIESGTQAIPDGIIARLSVIYELSEGEIRALEEARRLSLGAKGYSLKDYLAQDKEQALAFQHAFDSLSEDEKKKLRRVMSHYA